MYKKYLLVVLSIFLFIGFIFGFSYYTNTARSKEFDQPLISNSSSSTLLNQLFSSSSTNSNQIENISGRSQSSSTVSSSLAPDSKSSTKSLPKSSSSVSSSNIAGDGRGNYEDQIGAYR